MVSMACFKYAAAHRLEMAGPEEEMEWTLGAEAVKTVTDVCAGSGEA